VTQKISASLTTSISATGEVLSGGLQTDSSYSQDGSRETVDEETLENHSKSTSLYSYGGSAFDVTSTNFEDWASTIGMCHIPYFGPFSY
jgi:hypothetical protein